MLWWLLIACGARQVYDDRIPVDDTFPRAEPTAEARARYEAAAAYSEAHRGRAMLVVDGGAVVFETGQNGHGLDEPTELYSGTKSFSCAMFLAAEQDGLLTLDEPAARHLDAWQGDPDKQAITIAHLLQFTSGLRSPQWQLTVDGMREEQRVPDKYAVAVDQAVITPPGTAFAYGSVHLMVWGAVLTSAADTDPLTYLRTRVTDHIGMRFSGWNHDPAGNPMLPYGAWTTANEWAKYGVLARDDGAWQGEQVLPAGGFARCFQGSEPMPAYGLTWWLNAEATAEQIALIPGRWEPGRLMPSAPDDLVMAAGHHDQRLYVIPSRDLVVVRLSDGGLGWEDDAFLARLLGP